MQLLLATLLLAPGAAAAVPYQEYILALSSRTVRPTSVYHSSGALSSEDALLDDRVSMGRSLALDAFNSSVTYDFGKNIAGWINFNTASSGGSFTFTESSLWVSAEACDATVDTLDAPVAFNITGSGQYSAPLKKQRCGAYTNQLVTIDPTRGNAVVPSNILPHVNSLLLTISPDCWLNTTITNGTSALVDGAKRDRLVWSGDMAISLPGIAVSTYDLISVKNALDSLFDFQHTGGQLPYAGYPASLSSNITSFTCHLYALIGVGNVYQWSGDEAYVRAKWPRWKTAMEWAASQIDGTGLANVSAANTNDWARGGMGGHNIEANALLFHTLNVGAAIALTQDEPGTAERWAGLAAGIQSAAIPLLWQPDIGLFRDNETTTLAPQDGNAWAVKSGLVTDVSQIAQISEALQARWGEYGPPAPEAVDVVSPFISGFELEAHFAANRTCAALALIRGMWADFMLDDPRMTNSTFVEGYSTSGAMHYGSLPDQRLSFAHGWSTGPTSLLTTYAGGIQLLAPAGAVWTIVPQVGDLTHVDAGFSTSLGRFSSTWSMNATAFSITISTPKGTTGTIGAPVPGNFTSVTLIGTGGKGERVQADASGRV
ncbi:hypothetical protein GSI_12064 [Ganoderma sinense ZZ0214-1]|uniref:Alpha-L-rhamnosidase six-hairpin glycosidase domain-containing protein n=1 Tax=Ganoderma sinense ZZ0214-1 TaxID=1077348 RepID=A0A2G8RYB1_9APHY|nr:hypothetical protein GSI_12064 [Ganoderma sinense ZZ0214-1]